MTFLLLTGAGFSRNWGGWLASEAFEYLLGSPEVDDNLRHVLWESKRHNAGFEDALAQLQEEYNRTKDARSEKPLQDLQAAIVGMFNYMDQAFEQTPFEHETQPLDYSIRNFLGKFDAIFTLNQDLLLERHYPANDGHITGNRSWKGWHMPGTKFLNPALTAHPYYATKTEMRVPEENSAQFREYPGAQPYYKLHGSIKWIGGRAGQERLIIMGGNKAVEINQYPLLSWYHRQFREYLSRPATKLMVIGYSFSDHHINQAIMEAAEKGGLRLFIVDTQGVDVLDKQDPRHPMRVAGDLMNKLNPHIIGASRRPLAAAFGNDRVEFSKMMRFFS
jgi:SIR2-like protein